MAVSLARGTTFAAQHVRFLMTEEKVTDPGPRTSTPPEWRALVLAAGAGTRLRPLTLDRPKAMVPVAGVPMIAYALGWLRANGITAAAINLHHTPDPLVAFVGDGTPLGLPVRYSYEREPLGSAGALHPLRSFLLTDQPFVVLYGDVLTNVRLADVLGEHTASGADATLVLTPADDPRRAGMVEFDDQGWIRRLAEKPERWDAPHRWSNAGIYLLSQTIWRYLRPPGFADFAYDVFPAMLAAGARLRAFPSQDLVLDIGSHERLAEASSLVEGGRLTRPDLQAPAGPAVGGAR
jgi:NDP-sugar pyrophosphorylase family protein